MSGQGEKKEVGRVRRLPGFRLSGLTLTLCLLITGGALVTSPHLVTFFEQRAQIAELEQRVQFAKYRLDEVQGEVLRWSDPVYLEAQARDRLYYVYPGDVSYLLVGDMESAHTTEGNVFEENVLLPRAEPDSSWMTKLLSSAYPDVTEHSAPEEVGMIPSPKQGGSQ